jgi:LysR family glycine cleavage system transcriptional activator
MSDFRFNIPSTSSLIAFEATARLGGVIRASEELNTSQSAISRHIRNLETALGDKLFQRRGRGVVLTRSGDDYYVAVKSSLESLHAAGRGLRTQTGSVIIACTHEISDFLLLPALGELKRSMGGDAHVRVLNGDYDMLHLLLPAGVDIVFEHSVTPTDPSAVKLLDEEIVPVGSPSFVKRFERVLGRHPRYWSNVPRLDLAQLTQSCATWTTWFQAHDCNLPKAPVEPLESYQQVLEEAAAGAGMALGWNGFVNAYLESGRLVRIRDNWLRSQISLYAVLTQNGYNNRNAARFLKSLSALGEGLAGARQVSPQRQPTREAGSYLKLL